MRKTISTLLVLALGTVLAHAETLKGQVTGRSLEKKTLSIRIGDEVRTLPLGDKVAYLEMDGKPNPVLGNADFPIWRQPDLSVTVVLDGEGKVASVQLPILRRASAPGAGPAGGEGKAASHGADPSRGLDEAVSALSGKPLPPFTMKTLEGGSITNEALKGKVAVIDFWATWCAPCRMVSPVLKKLYQAYSPQGLAVLGASTIEQGDAKELVSAYAAKEGLPYPLTVDNLAYSTSLGVQGIPCILVVDKQGVVQKVFQGFSSDLETQLEAEVKKLLGA